MPRIKKQFDATPLQVLTDRQTRLRIVRLKRATGRSQAQIVRDILAVGLPRMEELWGVDNVGDE